MYFVFKTLDCGYTLEPPRIKNKNTRTCYPLETYEHVYVCVGGGGVRLGESVRSTTIARSRQGVTILH